MIGVAMTFVGKIEACSSTRDAADIRIGFRKSVFGQSHAEFSHVGQKHRSRAESGGTAKFVVNAYDHVVHAASSERVARSNTYPLIPPYP
jgi:hypothetical protein